ncbi:MAG: DUF2333 family protein [Arenicella sp.]|nr:DUF2333 family protein [Arenicella sp.]
MELLRRPSLIIAIILLILLSLLSWYWSREPDFMALDRVEQRVIGSATTEMLIKSVDTLLDKPGGYLSNDVAPPSVWLDNMPNWEFGVLQQVRDLAKALRNDYSRSQTQSVADVDLERAEPMLNVHNDAWIFPSAEGQYSDGREALEKYLRRLQDVSQQDAQFYARADNLNEWLSLVAKRLGSLSQRLSAARPQVRVNIDLAGDSKAEQSTQASSQVISKTSWFKIDDNFYEARGTAWALIHFLRAAEIDFEQVLADKNALVSLRQIIRELEATQQPVRSLLILNGSGMGMFANHSLVMSSYITRANAAIADMRRLLADG